VAPSASAEGSDVGWEELLWPGRRGPRVLDLRGTPDQRASLKADRLRREKEKAELLQKEAQALADKKEARKAAIVRRKEATTIALAMPKRAVVYLLDGPSSPVSEKSALYVLRDPNTGDVRYVGQTINPRVRLKMHTLNPGRPIRDWVKSLAGKPPLMQVLAWYTLSEITSAENQCIALCLEHGIALLNSEAEINRPRSTAGFSF